jgi:hypothetical protein
MHKPLRAASLFAALLACLACAHSTASPVESGARLHVLFIGNSLTYVNDLPAAVADMAASAGEDIAVTTVAKPDYALIDHLNGGSNALEVLQRGGWDFVVLQQGPSSLSDNADSLGIWTRMFDPHIRAAGARTALYMVWPAIDRRAFFNDVRAAYQTAATSVNGVFMPAGQAWLTAWSTDASLQLYGPDGFHPSELGTALAAYVIYERISGHDARALPVRPRINGHTLNASDATVRLLQRAAHDTNAQF